MGTEIATEGDQQSREVDGTQLRDANVPVALWTQYSRQVQVHLPGNILHRSVKKEFREKPRRLYKECLTTDDVHAALH